MNGAGLDGSVDRSPLAGVLDLAHLQKFQRLTLEHALAEVAAALRDEDVRFVVLKGAAFARWLYDSPLQRPYGDLDLLVQEHQLTTAVRAVAPLGFTIIPPRKTLTTRRVRPGGIPVEVELHHTLEIVRASPQQVWTVFNRHPGSISVRGMPIPVPSLAASAFLVVLHAVWHQSYVTTWVTPDGGPEPPLRDLGRALERLDLPTWRDAEGVAFELGAGPEFLDGLSLDPRGAEVAARLGTLHRTTGDSLPGDAQP